MSDSELVTHVFSLSYNSGFQLLHFDWLGLFLCWGNATWKFSCESVCHFPIGPHFVKVQKIQPPIHLPV